MLYSLTNCIFQICGLLLVVSGLYIFSDNKRILLSRLLAASSDRLSSLPQPLLLYSTGCGDCGICGYSGCRCGFLGQLPSHLLLSNHILPERCGAPADRIGFVPGHHIVATLPGNQLRWDSDGAIVAEQLWSSGAGAVYQCLGFGTGPVRMLWDEKFLGLRHIIVEITGLWTKELAGAAKLLFS